MLSKCFAAIAFAEAGEHGIALSLVEEARRAEAQEMNATPGEGLREESPSQEARLVSS
ncbi:MAG: hypothetical protein WDA11_02985 [Thiohalomonadaceae bacterium]